MSGNSFVSFTGGVEITWIITARKWRLSATDKTDAQRKSRAKSAAICISMDHWTTHWCRRRESNSHEGLPRRILNPLRLPFRHVGAGGDYNDRHGFYQCWRRTKRGQLARARSGENCAAVERSEEHTPELQ